MKRGMGDGDVILKKKEVIFIAGILILAGVLWLGFQITGKRSHNTIRITVDGKEFGTYSLSQDQVIHIGDTNVCEIKNGKVTMIEATCPDHYCMKQKAVDEHGGSIICLPNKVVIEGEIFNLGYSDNDIGKKNGTSILGKIFK